MNSLIKFLFNIKASDLEKVSDKDDYIKLFKGRSIHSNKKHFMAYEKAWDARKFEIDNYWKRATYFWALQVISLTGYVSVLTSDYYNKIPVKNPEILFCIINIGYITSISWVLINIGSKFWQRHWEKQIDMLEDKITGPLYKTIYAYKTLRTFSVSKINEIISAYFVIIWIILGYKYFEDHLTLNNCNHEIAWIELMAFVISVFFTVAMFYGYGRGNFGSSDFAFYKRKVFK